LIRTPDQRLRVFVSSTLRDLIEERNAAREAIEHLRLVPVMFELGARSHPPGELYRAYLGHSHIFVGIYWQKYGWISPGETISGLEEEYRLSGNRPKLIYIKSPASDIEPRLNELLNSIRDRDQVSYKRFSTATELHDLIENDLAVLLTEHFELARMTEGEPTDRRLHNLPSPPTPLIGRDQEVSKALELLTSADVRLLTLIGTGGTGKTRLALQVALHLVDRFEEGVFFVNLSPISDPNLVASTIATALNIRDTIGSRPVVDALKDYLRNKQTLLVLDNFEQVASAAPLLTELLESCPRLKVLVSSRVPLRVRGEKEQIVPPLELPGHDSSGDVESLRQYAAVELFIQRALDVKRDFAITHINLLAVTEICRRLDGLPLAIELAAARIKMLPPKAMLARLERRLLLLTDGPQDLPARQRALRSTIDWSYNLLDDPAKALFRRLSVFVGGWRLDAAEAVCQSGDGLPIDVLNGLETLLNNSLLNWEEGADGEPHFRMLETIREYALERLAASSAEEEDARRRHAQYYVALAELAENRLRSSERVAWTGRLETEHGNFRALMEWSTTPMGDIEMGLRCAGGLIWFWHARGYATEGWDWIKRLLASDRTNTSTAVRAKALYGSGAMAFTQGDFAAALPLVKESVTVGKAAGDIRTLSYALMFLGMVMVSHGDIAAARSLCEQSATLAKQMGDEWCEAFAFYLLGSVLLGSGDLPAARSYYQQSTALFRETGDPWGCYFPLLALGNIALSQDDHIAAQGFFEESAALCRNLGDRWGLSWVLSGLGSLRLRMGDFHEAKAAFKEGLTLAQAVGNPNVISCSFVGLARLASAQGHSVRAMRLVGAAESLQESLKGPLWPSTRLTVDRNIAEIRAQVDPESFQTAYDEGRSMKLEKVIAYALQEEGL